MIALDFKRGFILVLLAVMGMIMLAACDASQPLATISPSALPRAVEVGVAPVSVGTISVTTAYAAIVEAKDSVNMVPLGTGRLEKLNADVGSQVQQGELIAELSHGTLDARLQQALVTLRGAQVNLTSAQAATEPEQIKAQAQLDSALAALDQLGNPPDFDVQVANSAVAIAQSNLESKKTKLNRFLNPSASDLQSDASAVAQAQSNLDSANTKLSKLLNPSASDIRAAENAVSTAVINVNSANTALDQLLNPTAAALAASQQAVANAQSVLSNAESAVNTAITAELESASLSATLENAWQTLLNARVREQAASATLLNPSLRSALTATELAIVEADEVRFQGIISNQLAVITSTSVIPEGINNALLSENSTQSALDTTNEQLNELRNPSESTIAVARNKVAIAQAAEDAARDKLNDLQNADSSTIALAQNDVAIAQAALDSAIAKRQDLQDPSQSTVALAQFDVDGAQAELDAAEANVQLLTFIDPADLAAAEATVVSAQQALVVSQEPFTGFRVEAAQVAVDGAQAQVELINQQISELQVHAPFDGVVTRRWLSPGAMADPDTPIVTVVSTDVKVSLRVEETSIGSLQEGQSVSFISPALPGRDVSLQIDRIAPSGDEKTYTFLVQLTSADPIPDLKPGMSGQVTVLTQHENAMLVPKEAVLRHAGRPALFVVEGDKALLRSVDVGLNDKTNIEIFGDIQPGEQIVISGHNLLSEGDTVSIVEPPVAAATTG